MTKDKDLGSDAARSDPSTADRDRKALAEDNIEQSRRREQRDEAQGVFEPTHRKIERTPQEQGEADIDEQKCGQPTPGSKAAEPSPE